MSPDIESRPDLDALRAAASDFANCLNPENDDEMHVDAIRAALASPATGDSRPSEGLREAIDNLRRSVEGRCINPRCPSRHEGAAPDCTEAAIAAVALAATPEPTLDAAWAEAEAALPKGWAVQMVWGTTTDERWGAAAGPWPSKAGDDHAFGGGSTPAAALRALAARLHERTEP